MKKGPKIETRETKIEKARATLKEVPTATKVKAWTFQIEKTFYVIISFFAPRFGQQMSVYLSNRKGIKISNNEIDGIKNKDDYQMMFEQVIQKLIPEEIESAIVTGFGADTASIPDENDGTIVTVTTITSGEPISEEELYDEATSKETERYQAAAE